MKRPSLAVAGVAFPHSLEADLRGSLTDRRRVDGWSDDEIDEMAACDPDHPALDASFWDEAEKLLVSERSFQPIETSDLCRLADRAMTVVDDLARRGPNRPSGLGRQHLEILALAQGAALHFLDHRTGIKDFDVWAFFDEHRAPVFPSRPVWSVDYGRSRFGVNPDDAVHGYRGRRIDVIGRSIAFTSDRDPIASVRDWLQEARSASAHHVARRPVIAIYPEAVLGQIIWPGSTRQAD